MENLMLNGCQIRYLPSRNHKITTIKPELSSLGGYGALYNFKGTSVNLQLHSAFKSSSFNHHGKANKGVPLWVKATRFAGIVGYLIRFLKGILSKEAAFEKIEEKIEHTVEAIEEVTETVKEVTRLTEEIAEKVERQSTPDGIIHKTAEIVDNISEAVGKDAEIVENKVEKIKKTLRAIDEKVDSAKDAVDDIFEAISEDRDKGIDVAEKPSNPTVETKKDDKSVYSVDGFSKSNVESS